MRRLPRRRHGVDRHALLLQRLLGFFEPLIAPGRNHNGCASRAKRLSNLQSQPSRAARN